MTNLPYLAIHRVSGADAGSFLHAQLAADVSGLADGQAGFAAYCSPRGQVIALLLVCRREPDWLIVTHASLAGSIAARLKLYVLRARVSIEAEKHLQVAGLLEQESAGTGAFVYAPRNLSLRYLLCAPGTLDQAALLRWRREEIVRYVTWLQTGTSERFLPQMLGLDTIAAVSYSKGCYPGQEIIARARYLGKLKRKPVLLEAAGNPPLSPGDECTLISAGEQAEGIVVDGVSADGRNSTLLVVAPLDPDRPLSSLRCSGETWPARRIQRPVGD